MVGVPRKHRLALLVVALPVMMLAIYMALVYAPSPAQGFAAPDAQRIFHFHVAVAWTSYVAFIVTAVASVVYLRTRSEKFDTLALSSAEIGLMFCTAAIITGSIWARAEWGTFWRWEDMKLFMTLVLWLVYLSYIGVRGMIQARETRARVSAVFGVLGILCVPLSFSANRIWAQFHPTVLVTSTGSLQPGMLHALIVAVVAMTLFYIYLVLERVELEGLHLRLEDLKEEMGDDPDE
ncbi:MAG: cytochrome C assembly protein [Euryarchaeota archaeon]|nr:cytochrome C assembly protein [Euryarchaeota archaeon]